ncbi:hypothetical protein EMCG_05380 [[Emmonsia] crescens]|uniref:Uncharacterized protein n=1 Tax=[Emmonsia] crescens TaxID=73230 RepID=A0A0G2HQ67_9EURO|nr:hypothetical protein EMCG_05380 [Emmonsia crescens UAMH 3008]
MDVNGVRSACTKGDLLANHTNPTKRINIMMPRQTPTKQAQSWRPILVKLSKSTRTQKQKRNWSKRGNKGGSKNGKTGLIEPSSAAAAKELARGSTDAYVGMSIAEYASVTQMSPTRQQTNS